LGDLQKDVTDLSEEFSTSGTKKPSSTTASTSTSALCQNSGLMKEKRVEDLERQIAGRFQVIWSIFKAHSAAEDEFI